MPGLLYKPFISLIPESHLSNISFMTLGTQSLIYIILLIENLYYLSAAY